MNSPQEIYEIITSTLESKGMSASKFLIECGLGKDTISKLKAGSMPAKAKLAVIADRLGMEYADLCGVAEITADKESILKGLWALPLRAASVTKGVGIGNDRFDEIIVEVANYVGCKKDYLRGEDVPDPLTEPTNDSDMTYDDIIDIFDRCAVDDKYKRVQVRLSAIIKDNLTAWGLNPDNLYKSCGLHRGQLDFIFYGKKSLGTTVNFGFNLSNLMKIREVYGYSIKEMLRGKGK
jgi:transcriptional regulator with XRE-family HTH domain